MGFLVENQLADDAVRRNVGAGHHYFDRDTLKAVGSKVHEGYDMGDGATLVIMSNKDRAWGRFDGVVGCRRHYYLVIVAADGQTRNLDGEYRYDVSKQTGYWMSLRAARSAVKRYRQAQTVAA